MTTLTIDELRNLKHLDTVHAAFIAEIDRLMEENADLRRTVDYFDAQSKRRKAELVEARAALAAVTQQPEPEAGEPCDEPWPQGARLAVRCTKPAGHEGRHHSDMHGLGSAVWG